MLSNRFMRFLTTILMLLATLLPILIICKIVEACGCEIILDDGIIFAAPATSFMVCIIGQFMGDILNVPVWFNNGFVTFLKRAIFYIVVLGAMLAGAGIALSGTIEELIEKNASVFEYALCAASLYAPASALILYTGGYIKYSKDYFDIDSKKLLPFFFPISYIAGLVLGLVVSLVLHFTNAGFEGLMFTHPIIMLVMAAGSIFASYKLEVWPFQEEREYYGGGSSTNTGYSGSRYDDDEDEEKEEKRDCHDCAYYTKTNPRTGLYDGGNYCLRTGEALGYFDTLSGCSHFRG